MPRAGTPSPAQAAEEARRKVPGQALVAFGVMKDQDGTFWAVKYTMDGGIVTRMEKMRDGGPYEALAYEHATSLTIRHYMQLQIDRAAQGGRGK